MVALNWESVDGKGIEINKIFAPEGLVAGQTVGLSDQIQVWNGSSFDIYFYRVHKTNNPNKFTYDTCWVKTTAIGTPTTDTIPASTGFWFKRYGTTDRILTVSGGVKATTNEKAITSDYTMMGSAFPCDMVLNGTVEKPSMFDWAACATPGQTVGLSDQIQVWNGEAFDIYFYRVHKTNNPNKFTYDTSWVKTTAIGTPTTDTIAPGKGFWYKRYGTTTTKLVETSPIAK